ncbi:hypothetical protein [Clostridium massiliamazoniense]|uniref:hypothetical protein n=1 Tax=Clostridium massiliamazoniense TaxID=1347366 RepID=UPI0006D78552|nr:hypothetical protein [Clostridium massiliamazoniense]
MKNNSKKLRIIYIMLFLVFLVTVGVFFLKAKGTNKLKVAPNVITKDSDVKKTIEEMQKETDASMIGVKMNIHPVFNTGDAFGNILLENTSSNGNSYVMTIVTEDNEEIYKSDLITKGTRIDEIKLNKKLKKGKYPAIAYFTSYDKDQNKKGKSGINIEINVLN